MTPMPRGFSLVEVLATLGIVVFLMAALFQAMSGQTTYNDVAQLQLRESLAARTILRQIADELRSITLPKLSGRDPVRARTLLALGAVSFDSESTFAPTSDSLTDTAGADSPPFVEGAERFTLLGNSNRLIMMAHRRPILNSSLDRYQAEQEDSGTELTADATSADRRRQQDRWGTERQIFYLARPRPDALEKRARAEQPAEELNPDDPTERVLEPYFGGVIRQEVRLPFSTFAQNDAYFQLRDHVIPKEESIEEPFDVEFFDEPVADEAREIPLPDRVTTDVLTEEFTALRFRYHDGARWLDAWTNAERLPRAVEILLSVDPRAADPVALAEVLEEFPLDIPASDDQAPALPPTLADESVEPIFKYRLVVALDRGAQPAEPDANATEEPIGPGVPPVEEPMP